MPKLKRHSSGQKRHHRRAAIQRRRESGVSSAVLGSFHQGNEVFGNTGGSQCSCMALMAVLNAHVLSPSLWNSQVMDNVLKAGDKLYSEIRGHHDFLTVNELPRNVRHNGNTFELQYHESYCGIFGRHTTELPVYALDDAINAAQGVSRWNFVLMGTMSHSYIPCEITTDTKIASVS